MNFISANTSDSPSSKKLLSTPLKLLLAVTGVLLVSACQPSDNVSEDASENQDMATDNEGEQALAPQQSQTIEALAGVPMQQLATFDPQEIKQGGDTGISITSAESYSKPSSNLSASRKGNFFIGNAFLSSLGLSRLPVRTAEMVWERCLTLLLVSRVISKMVVGTHR